MNRQEYEERLAHAADNFNKSVEAIREQTKSVLAGGKNPSTSSVKRLGNMMARNGKATIEADKQLTKDPNEQYGNEAGNKYAGNLLVRAANAQERENKKKQQEAEAAAKSMQNKLADIQAGQKAQANKAHADAYTKNRAADEHNNAVNRMIENNKTNRANGYGNEYTSMYKEARENKTNLNANDIKEYMNRTKSSKSYINNNGEKVSGDEKINNDLKAYNSVKNEKQQEETYKKNAAADRYNNAMEKASENKKYDSSKKSQMDSKKKEELRNRIKNTLNKARKLGR